MSQSPSRARSLTIAAVIAALYAVLGYFGNIFSLTFGAVQIRFAEALTVLPFFFPSAVSGLTVGCLITNLASPFGPLDVIFGTLATAVAAMLTRRVKKPWLAPLPPILTNLIILPTIWAWTEVGAINEAFWAAWLFNAATFLIGQTVACYGLGLLLLRTFPRIKPLREMAARAKRDHKPR